VIRKCFRSCGKSECTIFSRGDVRGQGPSRQVVERVGETPGALRVVAVSRLDPRQVDAGTQGEKSLALSPRDLDRLLEHEQRRLRSVRA
jgi:hypothetical protein